MSMRFQKTTVLFLAILTLLTGWQLAEAQYWVYVTNSVEGSLRVVDSATNQKISSLIVGAGAFDVVLSPDSIRAYVLLTADYGSGDVQIVKTLTNTVQSTIVPPTPGRSIILSPNGQRLYVSSRVSGGGAVYVYDTSTNGLVATITGLRDTAGPGVFLPNGSRLYIGDGNAHIIQVIDPVTNTLLGSFPSGGVEPHGLAVTPTGDTLYVANSNSSQLAVFDSNTQVLRTTLSIPTANFVAITPDGKKAYVTSSSSSVSVVDTLTNTVQQTISLGSGSTGIAITPNGAFAYVAAGLGGLKVINTAHDTVVATVPFDQGLDRVAIGVALFQTVKIDIHPGSFPNSINPRSNGVTPVAILTQGGFDARTVDVKTVRFGRFGTEAAAVQSALEDVDRDGDLDLILHFRTQETGIQCGDTSAMLIGVTLSSQIIEGSDSIVTVGCQ